MLVNTKSTYELNSTLGLLCISLLGPNQPHQIRSTRSKRTSWVDNQFDRNRHVITIPKSSVQSWRKSTNYSIGLHYLTQRSWKLIFRQVFSLTRERGVGWQKRQGRNHKRIMLTKHSNEHAREQSNLTYLAFH